MYSGIILGFLQGFSDSINSKSMRETVDNPHFTNGKASIDG